MVCHDGVDVISWSDDLPSLGIQSMPSENIPARFMLSHFTESDEYILRHFGQKDLDEVKRVRKTAFGPNSLVELFRELKQKRILDCSAVNVPGMLLIERDITVQCSITTKTEGSSFVFMTPYT